MNLGKIPGLHVKTAYDFTLTRNDKVIQNVKPHNVLCPYISQFFKSYGDNQGPTNTPSTLLLGSGTAEPTPSDTALGNLLWYMKANSYSTQRIENGIKLTQTFIFPATASYVGTITEAGLSCSNFNMGTPTAATCYLATHCLLKDAEGNPISIEKTALDILTVTAEISYMFDISTLCDCILSDNIIASKFRYDTIYADVVSTFSYAGLTYAMSTNGLYTSQCTNLVNQQSLDYNGSTKKCSSAGTQRLGTDTGNTQYFNSIAIGSAGLINFPKPELFPCYDINGISVGIGDGEQKEWNNPLAYFVKDSDKVYVDGILQTRGVDYTIEHNQNSQMMTSVCFDLLKGKFISFTPHTSNNDQRYYGNIPFVGSGVIYASDLNYPKSIPVGKDIIFECAAPYTVNRCYMSGLQQKYYNNPGNATCGMTLSYSDDNETWRVAASGTCHDTGLIDITLEEAITAKYWKLHCDYANYSAIDYPVLFNGGTFLGYVGKPLTFANPPEEGAIITMDVQMDRPFKNANFVIDTSYSLQFVDA